MLAINCFNHVWSYGREMSSDHRAMSNMDGFKLNQRGPGATTCCVRVAVSTAVRREPVLASFHSWANWTGTRTRLAGRGAGILGCGPEIPMEE